VQSAGVAMIDWADLDNYKFDDEYIAANALLSRIRLDIAQKGSVAADAVAIVRRARKLTSQKGLMETFLEPQP